MSIYVPRLKKSFAFLYITKAIEDSVKALGHERLQKDQLDVITKFIEGKRCFRLLAHWLGEKFVFCVFTLGV